MARVFGGNAKVSFDSSELYDELRDLTLSFEVPPSEITAFDDAYKVSVAGKKITNLDVSGLYDADADQADDRFHDAMNETGTKTVVVLPGGGSVGAGNPAYTCTSSGLIGGLIHKHSLSLPVGDAAKFSAGMTLCGLTTRETS